MEEIELYIAAGEAERPSSYDGHRRCSYCAILKRGDELRTFWGLARVKDPTSLFALAINHALSHCLPDDLEAGPWPKVTVFVKSPKFWERIDQASRRESHEPKKMADQSEAWKRTATLRALFEISPARVPETSEEEQLFQKATALQKRYTKKALLEVPVDFTGLWADGELDPGAVQ